MEIDILTRRIRRLLLIFIAGLVASGLTAFPLVAEARLLERLAGPGTFVASIWPALSAWISTVCRGLADIGATYPFMLYGTDWLAFAHIVIAIAFVGPLRDPVKNRWTIEFGLIACLLVIPLALICGPIRGIPFFWRLIDCSFGVFGSIPLALALSYVRKLEALATGARA
jgi:hypothetical protein